MEKCDTVNPHSFIPKFCKKCGFLNSQTGSKITVIQSLVDELREDHHIITTCTSLEQLNQKFSERKPDLLIIGTLEESSCMEVHRQCAKKWQGLTIILLLPSHPKNIAI